MNASKTLRIRRIALGALSLVMTACLDTVRVPLAVPLPTLGGARPAAPSGIELIADFGDGVWGQEQERAEMAGFGIAAAFADRVEISVRSFQPTRTVKDSVGGAHRGVATTSYIGKVRLDDFGAGRGAVGVQISKSNARRDRADVQNERLSAIDLALPVEFYPLMNGPFIDQRLALYAAPRVVRQTFRDRLGRRREVTHGTMMGALAGVAARWRYLAVIGEVNFMRTPGMEFSGATFDSGWHFLPLASVRGIIPIGG